MDCGIHYRHGIVVKDRRDVFGREFVGCVADQQTCLSDCTVTDNNTPDTCQSTSTPFPSDALRRDANSARQTFQTYLIVATTILNLSLCLLFFLWFLRERLESWLLVRNVDKREEELLMGLCTPRSQQQSLAGLSHVENDNTYLESTRASGRPLLLESVWVASLLREDGGAMNRPDQCPLEQVGPRYRVGDSR